MALHGTASGRDTARRGMAYARQGTARHGMAWPDLVVAAEAVVVGLGWMGVGDTIPKLTPDS
jgi:hypothetical protein